jgi:hypothetical protein
MGYEKLNIEIRQTAVEVTDILHLIARGYSYDRILERYPDLTIADIMLAAKIALQVLTEYSYSDGHLVIDGRIKLSATRKRGLESSKGD